MIVASYSASQTIGLPGVVNLQDTSTGTDSNITERRVFIRDANGNYLVPDGTTTDYVVWPYADASISIACLKVDKAPNVTVQFIGDESYLLISSTDILLINSTDKFLV